MLKYQLLTPPDSNIYHVKEGGKLVSSPLGGAAGTEIFIYLMEADSCLELFPCLYFSFKVFSLFKKKPFQRQERFLRYGVFSV